MPTVKLPDFDDMMRLANKISDLLKQRLMLEAEISFEEADITINATNTIQVNGKPPSMEYIKNSYLIVGMDGGLKDKRKQLADVTAELDRSRLMLQINRDMHDVYRTESANERAASLA